MKKPLKRLFVLTLCLGMAAAGLSGCVPTYPKEELPQAVKGVFKDEYDMDVEVTVLDNTMGIYYPMKGLLDVGLGISEEAWDTISNLVLVASRVVLSTDAEIDFYCVIAQDARLPELQVIIIKYVEDVKRSMYRNISRNESYKRTLFSVNLTPQAKKERSVAKVFDKLGIEEKTRQNIMEEFFRSPPTKLSDIGYWRGNFYLKSISLEEFIAAQIANRLKLDFRGEGPMAELFKFKSAEGSFIKTDSEKDIDIKFKIQDLKPSDEVENMPERKVQEILHVANQVVYGYKFKDFDKLILEDQLENARLSIDMEDVYNFNKKKSSITDIVRTSKGYF